MWSALLAIALALVLAAAVVPAPASAHQLKAALTTVLFNTRSGRLEVMHRVYLHDAEQAASSIAGAGANLLEDAEHRQRFGIYVHERFTVFTTEATTDRAGDAAPLPLTLRGTEIDGDFLWIYQAMRLPEPPPEGLVISNRVLRDLWPDQVNTVNVEGAGPVQTLIFRDAIDTLTVRFPGAGGVHLPP